MTGACIYLCEHAAHSSGEDARLVDLGLGGAHHQLQHGGGVVQGDMHLHHKPTTALRGHHMTKNRCACAVLSEMLRAFSAVIVRSAVYGHSMHEFIVLRWQLFCTGTTWATHSGRQALIMH